MSIHARNLIRLAGILTSSDPILGSALEASVHDFMKTTRKASTNKSQIKLPPKKKVDSLDITEDDIF